MGKPPEYTKEEALSAISTLTLSDYKTTHIVACRLDMLGREVEALRQQVAKLEEASDKACDKLSCLTTDSTLARHAVAILRTAREASKARGEGMDEHDNALDYTIIRDEKIRSKVCELMSRMLDNPDEHGIYPTSRFLWEVETYILDLLSTTQRKLENADNLLADNKALRQQVADAEYDTERINWIDRNMDCDLAGPGLSCRRVQIQDNQTIREAIDAAREASEG